MMQQNHSSDTKTPRQQIAFSKNSLIAMAVLVIAIFSILTLALFSTNATIKDADNYIAKIDTAPNKVLTSQQIAKSNAYTIAISSVGEINKYDPAFTIAEDEALLVATISITNNTNIKQDLYPVNQIYVRSNEGSFYQLHPSMFVTEPLQADPVDPGQTAKGEISFAIPKNLGQPLLYIDLGWDNYVPVVYDVLK
jgi:uncharacterized protein YxeA